MKSPAIIKPSRVIKYLHRGAHAWFDAQMILNKYISTGAPLTARDWQKVSQACRASAGILSYTSGIAEAFSNALQLPKKSC